MNAAMPPVPAVTTAPPAAPSRLAQRRAHVRGAALLAASIVGGLATFIVLAGWGASARAALRDSAAFGPPSTLAGGRGAQSASARESLVLRSDNRGQVLFGRYCDSCHPGGQEGIGPSLRSTQFKRTTTSEDKIVSTVRKGGFEMPALPPTLLGDADLSDIARYVLSLPGASR
jgi:mono/diheme cytochrome c family protein